MPEQADQLQQSARETRGRRHRAVFLPRAAALIVAIAGGLLAGEVRAEPVHDDRQFHTLAKRDTASGTPHTDTAPFPFESSLIAAYLAMLAYLLRTKSRAQSRNPPVAVV